MVNISNKELISKIYNELIQLNIKDNNNNNHQPNWAETLNRDFFQKRHTDSQSTHEKMVSIINHQKISNQIPYGYTVEVRNRFKGLDLKDRVPDELWTEEPGGLNPMALKVWETT